VIGALDDVPGRLAGVGLVQEAVGRRLEGSVHLPVLLLPLGDPPAGERVLFEGIKAFLLGLLSQMHP